MTKLGSNTNDRYAGSLKPDTSDVLLFSDFVKSFAVYA